MFADQQARMGLVWIIVEVVVMLFIGSHEDMVESGK